MPEQIKRSGSNLLQGVDVNKPAERAKIPDDKPADDWESQYAKNQAKRPPTFTLNSEQVPWVKDYEVNKRYKLVIEVEVNGAQEIPIDGSKVMRMVDLTVKNMARP